MILRSSGKILAACALAVSPLAAGCAAAGAAPMLAPGGAIDPAIRDADVYLTKPADPAVPPGQACAVAARYVELVNAGKYAEVAALYADDATFLEPMRPNLQGRQQIDEFYTRRIGAMAPQVAAVAYFGDETDCLVELALHAPVGGDMRWVLVSMDHFIVAENGKISSMTAFARPMRAP